MTDDNKLNTLKDAPLPAPRADARARALAAAQVAFDANNDDNSKTESPNTTQAIVPLARPTEDINAPRRRFMLSRNRALAASIAALCIAAPLFYATLSVDQPFSGRSSSGILKTDDAPRRVATIAVPPPATTPPMPPAEPSSPFQAMPGMTITRPPSPQDVVDQEALRQRQLNQTALAEQRAAADQQRAFLQRDLDKLKAQEQRHLVPNDKQVRLEREIEQLKRSAENAAQRSAAETEPQLAQIYENARGMVGDYRRQNAELQNVAPKAKSASAPSAAAKAAPKAARSPADCQPHCNSGLIPGDAKSTEQTALGRVNDAMAKQSSATEAVIADLAQAGAKPPSGSASYLGLDNTSSATRFGFRGDAAITTPQQTLTTAEQLLADLRAKTERGEFDRTRLAEFEQKVQNQRAQIAALQQEQERALREAKEQRDRFEALEQNPIKKVADEPVSTFSLDVDTASYALARRQLNAGRLPRTDSIRVEEFINYFPYSYARPESADAPFAPQITVVPSPWNANNRLVHIGVKGYALNDVSRPRANLVLLVDISGSMQPNDRLPLLKSAFRMLVDQLRPDDTIGIVTYASGSDIRLAPTRVANRGAILAAIDSLNAGGSTSGARGLEDAYRLAEANFDKGGVNRIILGTDGDWNVGITNREQLKGYIERKRETGIFLSILGVGMGNYNDALMQTLARNGNGVAAYIDTLNEARKVLVDEASSSIFPIAKDVKVQIEFNPQTVSEYRLIGYEKRILKREDFNNDKVDAGDVGAGHTVTAIYEITPVNAVALTDPLRYGSNTPVLREPVGMNASEFGFLKLRYKLPKEDTSRLIAQPIAIGQQMQSFAVAPADVRFSIAVAAFGQKLRGSPHLKDYRYDDIIALAAEARGDDPFGYRAEFLNLVRLAKSAAP